MLHFPVTPAVYVSHDWTVWFDQPPPIPRVVRCVAVDDTIRDRLELVHGVPGERIRVLPNWVDLARFRPRGPLPGQPGRALVFSNYARPGSHLEALQEACGRLGIPLDVVGLGASAPVAEPEDLLPAYDLVFAKARCALESMAAGAARVRAEAGLEAAVDGLVALYREAVAEGAALTPDPVAEGRVLATFLRPVGRRIRQAEASAARLAELESDRVRRPAPGARRRARRAAGRAGRADGRAGRADGGGRPVGGGGGAAERRPRRGHR